MSYGVHNDGYERAVFQLIVILLYLQILSKAHDLPVSAALLSTLCASIGFNVSIY